MPRKSRIDAPGALHHIIARGIEQKEIFKDDLDRNNFLDRLGVILTDTKTICYAWALIPNHFHLLLRTGSAPRGLRDAPKIISFYPNLLKMKGQ